MSYLERLKQSKSRQELAALLGFTNQSISYLLYKKAVTYNSFEIPKRSGGTRRINAPTPDLKLLQKRLSVYLQSCIDEINKEKNIKTSISHGFRRRYSILTNANPHRNSRFVFNIDLEDYFGTINFGRVRGFFIKNKNFLLNENVATVIAQIACYDNALPQGSPCSPVISNLITHPLDIKLASLANNNNCFYSRYADDLTFSTNEKSFPNSIAERGTSTEWVISKKLEQEINRFGFNVNNNKTRMLYYYSRQDVTGLIVNKKINTKKEYWRLARSMCDSLFKTGSFSIDELSKDEDGNTIKNKVTGRLNQLNGILSHIEQVDRFNDEKLHRTKIKEAEWSSRRKNYKKFLFYRNFYASSKPCVICEGKTDNVYLQYATYSLAKSFPNLVEPTSAGHKLKIKFFNYSDTTDRILGLGGGAGNFSRFINTYENLCKPYKVEVSKKPVIIIIDNDAAAKSLFKSTKKKIHLVKGGPSNYYKVNNNLYLFAIPKLSGKDTVIEDYFAPSLLKVTLNKKTFNRSKHGFNGDKEFGKTVFAERVIRPEYKTIDFSKFDIILKTIDHIIAAHK